jgi:hypothetical protein
MRLYATIAPITGVIGNAPAVSPLAVRDDVMAVGSGHGTAFGFYAVDS